MNTEHRKILKDNRSILEKTLCLNGKLKHYLLQYKIFNKYMWEDVNSTSDLLDLLPSRGPKAFQNVIEILRKENYNEEANLLEKRFISMEVDQTLYYKMSSKPLGYCLLINNVEFKPAGKHDKNLDRLGSDVDAEALREFFERIGFEVFSERNMTTDEMDDCLSQFANKGFAMVDSMVVIILSHGNEYHNKDFVYGTDCNFIYKEDIYKKFDNKKCQDLQHKPKIFFFISCRGIKRDYGAEGNAPKDSLPNESTDAIPVTIPSLSDIFLIHSTLPHQVSVRDHIKGSYFCQVLIETLNEYYKSEDIETIIKRVNMKLEKKISVVERIVQVAEIQNLGVKKRVLLCQRS